MRATMLCWPLRTGQPSGAYVRAFNSMFDEHYEFMFGSLLVNDESAYDQATGRSRLSESQRMVAQDDALKLMVHTLTQARPRAKPEEGNGREGAPCGPGREGGGRGGWGASAGARSGAEGGERRRSLRNACGLGTELSANRSLT